jgi:uncharacterized protein YkwD
MMWNEAAFLDSHDSTGALTVRTIKAATVAIAACLCLASPTAQAQQKAVIESSDRCVLSPLEQEVLSEINRARTDPKSYAKLLEERSKRYVGNEVPIVQRGRKIMLVTREGPAAAQEAARALEAVRPVPGLELSLPLCHAANDHLKDQAPLDKVGHKGTDGSDPFTRIHRYSAGMFRVGEVMSLGNDSAQEVVQGFLIDDGVPGRGHRQSLLNQDYTLAGLACGKQARWGVMCIVDLGAPPPP